MVKISVGVVKVFCDFSLFDESFSLPGESFSLFGESFSLFGESFFSVW